jgi:nicotinamide-nucleotide amidase
VAYDTALKSALLGVDHNLLSRRGAVDAEVAAQMAAGARTRLSTAAAVEASQTLGLACTGVAGPNEQDGKSVGTVFIAVDGSNGAIVREFHFEGDREQIRTETVRQAIELATAAII